MGTRSSFIAFGKYKDFFSNLSTHFKNRSTVLAPVLYLMLSLGLGFMAYEQTGNQAIEDWKNFNPPTRVIWSAEIQTKGFHPVNDEPTRRRLYRLFPSKNMGPGNLWHSENPQCMVLAQNPEQGIPLFFCKTIPVFPKGQKVKIKWEHLGSHWDALDRLRDLKLSSPPIKKQLNLRDPREIQY